MGSTAAAGVSAPSFDGRVPLEVVPEGRRALLGPGGPAPARMMAAKALLPMGPEELVPVLAYLGSCGDQPLEQAAQTAAAELPDNIITGILESRDTSPHVLDYYGRLFVQLPSRAQPILLNTSTPDETFRFLAAKLRSPDMLDLIAQNQVRCLRCPAIIEALYYNADTRMVAAARIIEAAVRNGVSLRHIPGFKEIEASVLGVVEKVVPAPEEPDAAEAEDTSEFDFTEELTEDVGGLAEDEFQAILRGAAESLQAQPAQTVDSGDQNRALWRQLSEMSIAQKVRLALVGNAATRRLLVRDGKRLVAMAVLKSPALSDKEVVFFAHQKSLHEEVIRTIAQSREWTRMYPVKLALVKNPKTPQRQALSFIQSLSPRDLRSLSKDRDVPQYLQRAARQLTEKKEQRKS